MLKSTHEIQSRSLQLRKKNMAMGEALTLNLAPFMLVDEESRIRGLAGDIDLDRGQCEIVHSVKEAQGVLKMLYALVLSLLMNTWPEQV